MSIQQLADKIDGELASFYKHGEVTLKPDVEAIIRDHVKIDVETMAKHAMEAIKNAYELGVDDCIDGYCELMAKCGLFLDKTMIRKSLSAKVEQGLKVLQDGVEASLRQAMEEMK